MTLWEGLVLGVVQGLTEFIPISSTGHLTLAGRWMGLVDPETPAEWTAFLAVVQLGSLIAVLGYFLADLTQMARGFLRTNLALLTRRAPAEADRRQARLGWLVIAGTVPIGVVGLLLRDVIEGDVTKNLWVIALSLIGLAILLTVAELVASRSRTLAALNAKDALIVGLAQVVSLIPGSSRSGTTITGGLFAGLTRDAAVRFSFLLSIPAIGASAVFQLPSALASVAVSLPTLVLSICAAGVSGYLSIVFLLRYLQRHSTFLFIGYRVALGLVIIGLLTVGSVTPT